MSLKIDRVQLEIVIKNDQSRKRLRELEDQSRDLKKELKKLPEGTEEWTKKFNELKKVQREMDGLIEKIGLTGLSLKELTKRQRELNLMMSQLDPRTPEYKELATQLALVKGRMAELRGGAQQTGISLDKLANGFNKYMGMAAAFAATFAGIVFGFRKIIDISNEFEERIDYLSSLTGLAGDSLEWLSEKAKETSVSIGENGIRFRQSAKDIVDAYTVMGSARPELLKNKEDLAEVTEKALILAEAAKMETKPAIDAVAAAMNQFELPASEAVRIINAMAAGSLAGSAEINDITESLANVGTVADASNMSLEQTIGVLEVLGEKQLKGAEAGTMLRSALMKMKAAGIGYQSGMFNLRDALVEANEKLNTFSSNLEKDAYRQEIFGERSIVVGTILMDNIDKYDSFTNAVTGTNTALEQAATNTDNNAAKLAQARNRYQLLAIELGERLAPAITFSTNGFSYLIKAIMGGIKFFEEYGDIIKTITAGLLAYGIATKWAAMLEAISNKEKGIGLVLTKLKVFWHGVERSALLLSAAAQALLTGNITRATAAMRVFNTTTKLNPIGLLIGVLVAAGAALALYTRKLSSAETAQKELNKLNIDAKKAIVDQKVEMENLLRVARDEKISKEKRIDAIKKLNELSPDYLGSLTLETINTQAATTATENYIAALEKKAKFEAAEDKLKEVEKELLELKLKGADPTLWQKTKVAALSYFNASAAAGAALVYNSENLNKKESDLLETKKKLLEITQAINRENEQGPSSKQETENDIPTSGLSKDSNLFSDSDFSGTHGWNTDKTIARLEKIKKDLEVLFERPEEEDRPEPFNIYASEQLQKTFEGRREFLKLAYEGELIGYQEYKDKLKEIDEDEKAYNLKNLKEKADFAIDMAKKVLDVSQMITDALDKIDQIELNKFKNNQNKKKELLNKQLEDGIISREQYDARMSDLDLAVEKKEKAIAIKKAKRDKQISIFNVIIATAEAIVQALPNVVLAAIAGAMGAIQLGVIASTPIPQFYAGNTLGVFGKDDGKYYNAKQGRYGTQLVNGPTLIPGIGLTGEGKRPKELIFSGEDTYKIMNTPRLVDDIRRTISGAPQFAAGNYPNTITNNTYEKTFTDPLLIKSLDKFSEVMERIERNGLSVPWTKIDEKNTKMKQLTELATIK